MKLVKIIVSCVVVLLLLISVALNIFQWTGVVKHTEETQADFQTEYVELDSSSTAATYEAAATKSIEPEVIQESAVITVEDFTVEYLEVADESDEEPFYQDDYIRVTYVQSEEKAYGSEHEFRIENLSNVELTILFTDVHINGELVFTSGLTCEHLKPGSVEVEELVLVHNDGEPVSINTDISFKVKLVNAKSYFDIYESEQIAFDMEEVS
jgi:hypothetical protein